MVSQTGIREARRDKATNISEYVVKNYLSREDPFQGSKLEIRSTGREELFVAVTNLNEDAIHEYVTSKQIPDERELYDDRLVKIVVKGIREWCSDKVFETFSEI
ncbi:MAG: hypothetical protein M1503_08825 [Thaumarchaeota archaeon]|nr:hypothetical protein [Nitrososphaerota archaeon]MCL5318342.1 hypothetical protein [Nitrososphaerota archaeon]